MIEGQKFSQVYIDKGSLDNDSIRMRNRISAKAYDLLHSDRHEIKNYIEVETGAKVPFVVNDFSLPKFFEKCEIRDLLDSVTLIFRYFFAKQYSDKAK